MMDKVELLFSDKEEAIRFREDKDAWKALMDEQNLTYDYLPSTAIYLYQRKDMFRNNTDTALLGQFIEVRKKESVLDIGTNNGALLLYASQFCPASLVGVDIQKEACELACKNMEMHHLKADIRCMDIKDLQDIKVDVILCNPPYFDYDDPRVEKTDKRNRARHQMGLTLHDIASQCAVLLNDKGRVYMVHRAEYLPQIMKVFMDQRMEIKKMQFVHHDRQHEARSVLVEIRKLAKPGCHVLPPRYIHPN